MNIILPRIISIMLFLMGCNNAPTTPAASQDPVSGPALITPDTTLRTIVDTDSSEGKSIRPNVQQDSVILLSFAADSTTLTASGHLSKDGEPVICYLPVDRKVNLHAWIIPNDADLNIRFSQLVMPDGETDGPFSLDLKYELRKKGMYKIIIGRNQMADGKKSGDFILRVEAKQH